MTFTGALYPYHPVIQSLKKPGIRGVNLENSFAKVLKFTTKFTESIKIKAKNISPLA